VRASSILKLTIVPTLVLAACGDSKASDTTVAVKQKITIGSTTDPMSELVAEIYGQSLEKAEFRVARKKPFATSAELMTALSKGDVELTGFTTQGLIDVLAAPGTNPTIPNTTADQAAAIDKSLPGNLKISAPSTAEDKDVVYCSTTFATTNGIKTLSDLGGKPGLATLAAPDGFDTSTPLGGAGLKDTYSIEFKAVVPTPIDKVADAVTAGTADCGVGRAADPTIGAVTYTILQDDKTLVPNDVILPVMTDTFGDDVVAAVDQISARLTPDSLRALMSRLKVDGATPEIVANEFTGNAGT